MITLLRAQACDVPADDGWLVPAERAVLHSLRIPKRREEWRLGRWTAKQAIAAAVRHVDPRDIEIRAAADGAPEAFDERGTPIQVALSLSHRDGVAVCAVATPAQPLGCDVEAVESRAPAFAREWFSAREQAMLSVAPPAMGELLATVLWSAKESVLKLRRSGLREDPRAVEIDLRPGARSLAGWHTFDAGGGCEGRWRVDGSLVTTVALDAADAPPRLGFASLHHGLTDP